MLCRKIDRPYRLILIQADQSCLPGSERYRYSNHEGEQVIHPICPSFGAAIREFPHSGDHPLFLRLGLATKESTGHLRSSPYNIVQRFQTPPAQHSIGSSDSHSSFEKELGSAPHSSCIILTGRPQSQGVPPRNLARPWRSLPTRIDQPYIGSNIPGRSRRRLNQTRLAIIGIYNRG